MPTPFEIRNQQKVARLVEAADLYRQAIAAGSVTPSRDVADRLELTHSTARNLIFRARAEGFLEPVSAHRPRAVDWGPNSWRACATCRVPWPCTPADAGNWSD